MIRNGEGQHYIAVKNLSVLLRGIISKHNGHFYYLSCLHKSYKKVCENKDFCSVEIPLEDSKVLDVNQYKKI